MSKHRDRMRQHHIYNPWYIPEVDNEENPQPTEDSTGNASPPKKEEQTHGGMLHDIRAAIDGLVGG